MRDLSLTKKKILLLLLGGLTLSLNRSPRGYFKILGGIKKEWSEVNRKKLASDIRQLYQSKLISMKSERDGTLNLILAENGRKKALKYNLEKMEISDQKWDGKWRVVAFDIPERRRDARDSLRGVLKRLGFYELQRSVFIHPYECRSEIEFIVEFFQVNRNVRYGVLESIDNELHLRHIFRELID